jgi:hypothetical protein
MSLTFKKLPLIQLKSFSGSGVVHTLDRSARTCTCHHFSAEGHCKHLDEFGAYKRREFSPDPPNVQSGPEWAGQIDQDAPGRGCDLLAAVSRWIPGK